MTAGIDHEGRLVASTYPEGAKVANARRNPAAFALALSDDWNGEWVQVWGTVAVLDLPDALEPLVAYYRTISGEHPDWDEYRYAMVEQGKSLLRLTIERWGPIAIGGFPLASPEHEHHDKIRRRLLLPHDDRASSGQPHRIEIWCAADGDTLYLLSGGGRSSDLVQNLSAGPVLVEVNGDRRHARARVVEGGDEGEGPITLFAKYAPRYDGDLTRWRDRALPIAIDLDT